MRQKDFAGWWLRELLGRPCTAAPEKECPAWEGRIEGCQKMSPGKKIGN